MKRVRLTFLSGLMLLALTVGLSGCGSSSNSVPDLGTTLTTHTVGGTVNGLSGAVVLQNNSGDNLKINAEGPFTFTTGVTVGSAYDVTVLTQPTGQTCTASASSGMIAGANVTDVAVACTNNTYTVGGTVTGLGSSNTVVLQNNGGEDLTIKADGPFTFATEVANAAAYNVQVLTQPAGQICTASANSGVIAGTNVTNVAVTCSAATVHVGGTISGLINGETLTLHFNGSSGTDYSDDSGNGSYSLFDLASGSDYTLTATTLTNEQTCTIANGAGTNVTSSVINADVTCVTNPVVTVQVIDSPDSSLDVRLAGVTVEVRNEADDSVFESGLTDGSGVVALHTPKGLDFYLHADGSTNTTNSTVYYSDNLQVQNITADPISPIFLYLVDHATVVNMATSLTFDSALDAIFAVGVDDSGGNAISGVSLAATPTVSNMKYQQPGGLFSPGGPTTKAGDPAIIGNVFQPLTNETYSFTLSGATGYTIDTTFRLRLIPGELSEPIEP